MSSGKCKLEQIATATYLLTAKKGQKPVTQQTTPNAGRDMEQQE